MGQDPPDKVEVMDDLRAGDAAPHDPAQRRSAVRRLLRAEVVYGAALVAFAVLAVFARFNAYFGWDARASRALQGLDVPGLAGLMYAASWFGNGLVPWVMTTLTALVFLWLHRRSEAAGLVLSAGGGELVNRVMKLIIARPRPSPDLVNVLTAQHTESFPSGHVTFYVCFFGFLFFVAFALLPRGSAARRAALGLAALPVLLVGFSRVYLGAHWPSDTLGAYLFSGLWLALSLHLYRRWKERATFHNPAAAVGE